MTERVVEVRGIDELVQVVERLERFASRGEIGSVYSRGAGANRYEFDVMEYGRQAPIHQGRWQTDKSIAEDNEKAVVEKVGDAAVEIIKGDTGTTQLEDALLLLYRAAIFYPPPPPNSRYVRTYRLRDSWDIRLNRG